MKRALQIRFLTCAIITACYPSLLWAHEAGSRQAAMQWSWEPFVIVPIVLSSALYCIGTARMRGRSGPRISPWPALSFAAGTLTLVIALDSTIHLIGGQLFWV